jgi:hypothetical protein
MGFALLLLYIPLPDLLSAVENVLELILNKLPNAKMRASCTAMGQLPAQPWASYLPNSAIAAH